MMLTDAQIAKSLPALSSGNVAVITGAASGIGRAAAKRCAGLGMRVVLADLGGPALESAGKEVSAAAGEDAVLTQGCDVSRPEDVAALAKKVEKKFGTPSLLMNNAGVGNNPGKPWENRDAWRKLIDINFWGAVYGAEAFAPAMIAAGKPAIIVNTGSKQGITTPPGNLAYNVSKAALKAYTEGLSHELRNTRGSLVKAHLLIPGFTFTGITGTTEKPAAAWTGEQVVGFMLESLVRGDFYILCPDNDVKRELDERRMAWAVGDIIQNRPALSRWHPDYAAAFDAFLKR
jgi:NAD(P)-dependent dehydrogenase (short-subunit alcohol dehydrogenase family)